MEKTPGAEQMQPRVIKTIDYRIKADYLMKVLQEISQETGVQVGYYSNTIKGAIDSLSIFVDDAVGDEGAEKALKALEGRADEIDRLSKQSIAEVEGSRK